MKRGRKNTWFRESLDYVAESRQFVYIAITLFILSGVIGFVFADKFDFIEKILKMLVDRTEGLNTFELITFIFFNNAQSSFLAIIFGIVLGIAPAVNAIANGTVIGYVLSKVYYFSGASEFWRLLPHGIFELPAIFISLGLGMKLGMCIFAKDARKEFVRRLVLSLKSFLTIILPLLIIAAIIEGFLITARL
ncbi:MAG: stage II sporulation protein M [Nanoarchaeota archaeon]